MKLDSNFAIVSNNCWGGELYKELNLPYNTPFIGLFIPPECYINLLENFDEYMFGQLNFVEYSKYDYYNQFRALHGHNYPIGVLSSCIEIHFLHYSSMDEAKKKWLRRSERLASVSNVFFKFCDREINNTSLIERFDQLEFKNKVCFTTKKYPFNSIIQISELKDQKEVLDGKALYSVSRFYFDALKWLKTGDGSIDDNFKAVQLKLRTAISEIRKLFNN